MEVVLDLRALPILNRKMVKEISARKFFETEYALVQAQAAQKVLGYYADKLDVKKVMPGLLDSYGTAGVTWLREQGISDGWQAPHTTGAPIRDYYMGKQLKVSLAKYSSLPTVEKAIEKMKSGGKPTPTEALLIDEIKRIRDSKKKGEEAWVAFEDKAWIAAEKKAAVERARALIFEIAQTTFALIVGQVWFAEFASLDENEMAITVDGTTIQCKAEMIDLQIPV